MFQRGTYNFSHSGAPFAHIVRFEIAMNLNEQFTKFYHEQIPKTVVVLVQNRCTRDSQTHQIKTAKNRKPLNSYSEYYKRHVCDSLIVLVLDLSLMNLMFAMFPDRSDLYKAYPKSILHTGNDNI